MEPEKKEQKFKWVKTLMKRLLRKLEDPGPEYEDPDSIMTIREPYRNQFFPYSKHKTDREKLTRHIQIDGNEGLRNLDKQPIGTLICKDTECLMNSSMTMDDLIEMGNRPTSFIPDDPVTPIPNGYHYVDSPVAMAKEPLTDEIIYFIRIPVEFEKITKENRDRAKAHITRNIRKMKKGRTWNEIPDTDVEGNYEFDSEWQSSTEQFLDEEVINLENLNPMENPIEVLEKNFEKLLIKDEIKETKERGRQERQHEEKKWGKSVEQWQDENDQKWRDTQERRNNREWRKEIKQKFNKKSYLISSSSESSDTDHPYLVPRPDEKQGRQSNTTEQSIWLIPTETDVPTIRTFMNQLGKMLTLTGYPNLIDKVTWSRIQEEKLMGVMLHTDHQTMELYNKSKCNKIARKINKNQKRRKWTEMGIIMRKSDNWIFARDNQENIKIVKADLQITLFNRMDDIIWAYLMTRNGKTKTINEIPELLGQKPYKNEEWDKDKSGENHPFQISSNDIKARYGPYQASSNKSWHKTQKNKYRKRESDQTFSSSEEDTRLGRERKEEDSQMGAEIDKEIGAGIGMLVLNKGIRKLSIGERGNQGIGNIRALGCKIAEDTVARIKYGIGISAIPVYQSEDVSELEQTVARPQLFRDVVKFWKDAFLVVLSRFKVEGRMYSELRPTFDNRRSTNQMRQVRTLIEAVPYYNLDMDSSNRATLEQHLEYVVQYMIASGISHKLSDIVIEKSFSKKSELSRIVNSSAREHGIHAETLRSLVSFWLTTLCNNVSIVNTIEEQESVAIKLCYNEFAKFNANRAINVAREHAMRLAPQNRSILRRMRENVDTKEAIELVKEDLLRKILLGGAEANDILSNAQQSYNSPSAYNVQSSAMGQLLDFSTQPIENMISALRLATRLQMDKFANTNILPKIKTGAILAKPVSRSPRSRERTSSKDRGVQARSRERTSSKERGRQERPKSRANSPYDIRRKNQSPGRRSRSNSINQSRRRISPNRGSSPRTRTNVGAAKSEGKEDISEKCPFCKKNEYDCIRDRGHCRNLQHYTLKDVENLKTARTRENCPTCKIYWRARSPKEGDKSMDRTRNREDSLNAARTAQRVKDRIWDRTALYGNQ